MSDVFPSVPAPASAPGQTSLPAALQQVEELCRDFETALRPGSELIPPTPSRIVDALHGLSGSLSSSITMVQPQELRDVLGVLRRLVGIETAELRDSGPSLATLIYLMELRCAHSQDGVDWGDLPEKVAALAAVLKARADLRETLR